MTQLPTLAAILGHTNVKTTMRYVHIGQADIAAAMRVFEAQVQRKEKVT